MSEYLSKKAVLEHIRREIDIIDQQKDGASRYRKTFSRGAIRGLKNLEHVIQSGAFDVEAGHQPERPGRLEQLDILQERLDRVAAIVDVIEQHGDLDVTTLAQLQQALSWVPDVKGENVNE